LLVEADAFDVGSLRLDVAATGGRGEEEGERGEDAAGSGNAAALGLIDCVGCGLHLARNRRLGRGGGAACGRAAKRWRRLSMRGGGCKADWCRGSGIGDGAGRVEERGVNPAAK
jgi:hypothetical protein